MDIFHKIVVLSDFFIETRIFERKKNDSDETGQILNWSDLMPTVIFTLISLM